jgi:hypothetical protein
MPWKGQDPRPGSRLETCRIVSKCTADVDVFTLRFSLRDSPGPCKAMSVRSLHSQDDHFGSRNQSRASHFGELCGEQAQTLFEIDDVSLRRRQGVPASAFSARVHIVSPYAIWSRLSLTRSSVSELQS